MRLTFAPDSVSLEIKDNGHGLSADQIAARTNRQFGLLGMSERAKRLGGRFDMSSSPEEGTTVRAIIPLGAKPDAALESSAPATLTAP
jgi:signal transduction histidine kinase